MLEIELRLGNIIKPDWLKSPHDDSISLLIHTLLNQKSWQILMT
jgi:hypothetical protein